MIEKNKFNYIPKVESFMERSGYKMDIFDILNEPVRPGQNPMPTDLQKNAPKTEIFYYTPSDINGKN